MKLLIMGAGGVGGYFGACLARAGLEVVFVARGAHKAAMAGRGLTVLSERGDIRLDRPRVAGDPAEAGVCDGVLVWTKLRDLQAAAEAIRPAVGPESWVMSLQNGVDKERVLAEVLGPEPVIGGVAQVASTIVEPGVVRHTGRMAKMLYGELDGRQSERVIAFDAAARAAEGFDAVLSQDIGSEIWKKFVFLAPFSGITCADRSLIGPIRADPERRRELAALVTEAVAVARAEGIALAPGHEDKVMTFVDGLDPAMKSSMLHDLEAGRPLELDWLSGAVCRLARIHGIPTPATDRVCAALASLKDGAPG